MDPDPNTYPPCMKTDPDTKYKYTILLFGPHPVYNNLDDPSSLTIGSNLTVLAILARAGHAVACSPQAIHSSKPKLLPLSLKTPSSLSLSLSLSLSPQVTGKKYSERSNAGVFKDHPKLVYHMVFVAFRKERKIHGSDP